MIVEYIQGTNVDGKFGTPSWVTNGGYAPNPVDDTLIGFVAAEAELPDETVVLTEQELIDRMVAIGMDDKTDAEVATIAQQLIDQQDL